MKERLLEANSENKGDGKGSIRFDAYDARIVQEIWMDFLVDMRWIDRNTAAAGASGYIVTAKGKEWLAKLSAFAEPSPRA